MANIFKVVDKKIVNVIVGDENWRTIFSPDDGHFEESELSGDLVIGAKQQKDGSFSAPR
jgi:hypothetical protein